jgi:hypothetical protein
MSARQQIAEVLLKWLVLGVVVAALPVIFYSIDFLLREEGISITAVLKTW